MLGFERRDLIENQIVQNKKVLVSDLASKFDVSEETIRRDLKKMEEDNILARTHGGAILNIQTNTEVPHNKRHALNPDEKKAIAKKALPYIPENSTLFFDASSTSFELLDLLAQSGKEFSIMTNSITALNIPYESTEVTILSTGGQRRERSHSLIGFIAEGSIMNYNVDFSVVSCKSIDLERGIMDTNEQDASIKRAMLQQSRYNILLVDSTKFNQCSLVKVFDLDAIDILVTDAEPSEEWIQICQDKDIELIY